MNRRAIGCGGAAAVVFVAIGILGVLRAGAPAECPNLLPYQPDAYEPVGSPAASPALEGIDEPLVRAGSTSFGLASWDVYVEPAGVPGASGDPLPQRIVLDCGDGTYQAYRRGIE